MRDVQTHRAGVDDVVQVVKNCRRHLRHVHGLRRETFVYVDKFQGRI